MPKYGFYLIETTTVYKEVEAEDRTKANEIVGEFAFSDHIDWGDGKMEVSYECVGEITDD